MKKLLQLKLKILARWVMKKYQPTVVGITGSVGKTSAKEAIALVLASQKRVRSSQKNYNNEIGLPLTILGADSPGRNLFGWLSVFFKALALLLKTDQQYPEVLVLEMGVDRPGDLAYLTRIAPPDVGLVTGVSYSHLEYFGSLVNIKKEKQILIEKIRPKGLAILNYDNDLTQEMAAASPARVLTYGLKEGADLVAQDIMYNFTKGAYELNGLNFKFDYKGATVPVRMPNVMSQAAIYAALAAAAVGLYFDFNLIEIADSLRSFSSPKGRMNFLPGVKHTFIIDDTYNSSPEAAWLALETLRRVKVDEGARKYAVLGDMLEIGHYSEEGHQLVGKRMAESGIDYLIAVGERARDFIRGAKEAGLEDDYIFYFDKPEEAGRFLQNRIKAGDVILVKGSQGVRLEKIVKEIMAEPERAADLLVRQGKEWENK